MNPKNAITVDAIQVLVRLSKEQPPLYKNGNRDALISLFGECESKEHFQLLEKLITNFNYLTSADLEKGADKVAEYIISDWGLNPKRTLIAATTDDDKTDGAQVFSKSLEAALARKKQKYSIKNRLGFVFNTEDLMARSIESIVLVDDFIGTGDKITKLIQRIKEHIDPKIAIFVASLAGMRFGIKNIETSSKCKVFCPNQFERGISDSKDINEVKMQIDAMIELERPLIPPMKYPRDEHERSYSFGYGQSEALFILEGYTVPNNVFPIFWWGKFFDIATFEPTLLKRKNKGARRERTTLLARG